MTIPEIDKQLTDILHHMVENEAIINNKLPSIHKGYYISAKNLFRYLILRSFDLRKYHDTLSDLGISSMRSAEGYVFSNLHNVIKNLRLIQGKAFQPFSEMEVVGYKRSKKLLKKHANSLFNEIRKKHFTEIMVTIPLEAADDIEIIREMALSGMEIARINLSHGDMDIWERMINIIRIVREETQREIKIYMDLSGPKIRTSTIEIHAKNGKVKNGIPIKEGEHVILTKRDTLGKKSVFGNANEQLEKAEIGVSLHEIIDDAQVGDIVLFDDGMITSKIIAKRPDELELVITSSNNVPPPSPTDGSTPTDGFPSSLRFVFPAPCPSPLD